MRKDRYVKRHFHKKSLTLVLALALSCVLLVCGVVGGTLAWLTDKTDDVVNTVTTSDIDIELTETTTDFKMIPGWTIPKDPWAKVSSDSEDCYLFVRITGENASITPNDNGTYSLGDYIVFSVDSKWTALDATNYPGVYYMEIDAANEKNVPHYILAGGSYTDPMDLDNNDDNETVIWTANQVAVKPSITKEMMNAISKDQEPKLTFQAYAIQLWKTNKPANGATAAEISAAKFDAETAWLKIKDQ